MELKFDKICHEKIKSPTLIIKGKNTFVSKIFIEKNKRAKLKKENTRRKKIAKNVNKNNFWGNFHLEFLIFFFK